MKNTIAIIVIIILLIVAGLWYVGSRDSEEVVTEESEMADLALKGTVSNVDDSQVPVDGPYVVEVAIEGGDDTARILVPSMGIQLCEARDNIADIGSLEEGTVVEVRGDVNPEDGGSITPCGSEDHYLRIVS